MYDQERLKPIWCGQIVNKQGSLLCELKNIVYFVEFFYDVHCGKHSGDESLISNLHQTRAVCCDATKLDCSIIINQAV